MIFINDKIFFYVTETKKISENSHKGRDSSAADATPFELMTCEAGLTYIYIYIYIWVTQLHRTVL